MHQIMKWKPEYSVKVEEIDKQHIRFHNMLNDFYTAFVEGKDLDVLEKTLNDIIEYAVYHFETEEKYFEKFRYKLAKEHHKIHEDMKAKLSQFMMDYKEGKADISMELLNFLINWFIEHLTIEDQKYVETLAGKSLEK